MKQLLSATRNSVKFIFDNSVNARVQHCYIHTNVLTNELSKQRRKKAFLPCGCAIVYTKRVQMKRNQTKTEPNRAPAKINIHSESYYDLNNK